MDVYLCGVRGSTPATGAAFAGIGGATSCVALAHDGELPSLVLDAGTGLRRLDRVLGEVPFRGTILLSHLHWDHTQGLPFFRSADHEDAAVRLLLPERGEPPTDVIGKVLSPPHFPLTIAELRGRWCVGALDAGAHEIEGFRVVAADIPHKGGRTFGFRITDGATTLAYLSDHGPLALGAGPDGWGDYHPAALMLCAVADLVLHDAQFTAGELAHRPDWGHSAADYAAALCRRATAKRLLTFHHDPERVDADVLAMAAALDDPALPVGAATEDAVIRLR